MDEIKKSYEILGLPALADKQEVEDRYSMLLKRERARIKQNPGTNTQKEADFELITAAYKRILAYEDEKYREEFNKQEYGKYRKLSGPAQKIDHFWRYYKFHTLGSILLIILIIYGISSYLDQQEEKRRIAALPPVDVNLTFLGTFASKEDDDKNEKLNAALLADFPGWGRFDGKIVFVPQDEMNQPAYLQKATVVVATEFDDVYVTDEFMLGWMGKQGAFLDLGAEPELAPLLNESNSMKFATVDDPEEKIYAIDLSKTSFIKTIPVIGGKFYAGIRVNGENPEKSVQFLKHYLETSN